MTKKVYFGNGFAIRLGNLCIGWGSPKGLDADIAREGIDRSRPSFGK